MNNQLPKSQVFSRLHSLRNILTNLPIKTYLIGAGYYLFFLLMISLIAVLTSVLFENPIPETEESILFDLETMRQSVTGRFFLLPWYRWDTVHYIAIARLGYGYYNYSTAWPPLYPFAIKVLLFFITPTLLAALVASNLFGMVFFALFHKYAEVTRGQEVARQSMIWIIVFPTSFFLFAGFSESLYLAFAVAAILACRSGRGLLAGFLGAMATLTRHQGVVLALPIAIYAIQGYLQGTVKSKRQFAIRMLPASYPIFVFGLFALYAKHGLLVS